MVSAAHHHPLRIELNNELHARPFPSLEHPLRVTHLALLSGEQSRASEIEHLRLLCRRLHVAEPGTGADHHQIDGGSFELKWERHTEFSTYTIFRKGRFETPFDEPALSFVPADWIDGLPGSLLVGLHVAMAHRPLADLDRETIAGHFGSPDFVGSTVSCRGASLFTDFRLDGENFGRLLIFHHDADASQIGRVFQRALEIETYRMMALLAFPVAREARPVLSALEAEVAKVIGDIGEPKTSEEESALLHRLTHLSAAAEELAGKTGYRFAAARAYDEIVASRIAELGEERIWAQQTFAKFMARRLGPAMKTCQAAEARQNVLEQRIGRATDLLRTRVDVALEEQNAAVLKRMNERALLQLRLQQTVEGLSVVAISYYAVSLLGYVFKAAEKAGLPVEPTIAMGIAAPVVLLLAWLGLKRLRRHLSK